MKQYFKNLKDKIRLFIFGNKPAGAPSLRKFRKLTIRQRKLLKITVNGRQMTVISHLEKMADKLPLMRWETGKVVNHKHELVTNYLHDGFDGVENYLKQVEKATKKNKLHKV